MPALRPSPRRLAVCAFTLVAVGSFSAGAATAAAEDEAPRERTEQGTLLQVVADDFAAGEAYTTYGLERRDQTFVALEGLTPAEARGLVGQEVRVTGRALGRDRLAADQLEATGDGSGGTAGGESGTAAAYKQVAVILVNFTDDSREPVTRDAMRTRMFGSTGSVDAYYQDSTDGALGLSGEVFGWHTVSRSSTSTCDYSAWGNAARTAATNAGVNLSAYSHVMYLWPHQSACGWSGLGQHPGSTSWVNGSTSLRITSHELGHNFGEHHASSARCTESGTTVTIPSAAGSCSISEYGDPFTVMGGASSYLHTGSTRSHLGYLAPTTTAAGQVGSWSLAPLDGGVGTRTLRIPRGDGSYLALEFRQPHGGFDTFTATSPLAQGVTLRLDWGNGTKQTQLFDATPATSSFNDAPLLAGMSVTDPVSAATITVDSVSSSAAKVSVSYPSGSGGSGGTDDGGTGSGGAGSADTTAPTAVKRLKASLRQGTVTLSWGAATDDVGVVDYEVSRGGTVAHTSTTRWVEEPGAGSWTYTVVARDAAGNRSAPASVQITVR